MIRLSAVISATNIPLRLNHILSQSTAALSQIILSTKKPQSPFPANFTKGLSSHSAQYLRVNLCARDCLSKDSQSHSARRWATLRGQGLLLFCYYCFGDECRSHFRKGCEHFQAFQTIQPTSKQCIHPTSGVSSIEKRNQEMLSGFRDLCFRIDFNAAKG